MREFKFISGIHGAWICCCLSLIAVAGKAQTLDDEIQSTSTIESITVTATRQDSNLIETPIAISAFNMNEQMEGRFERMEDVANQVPGLTIGNTGNSTFPEIFLRGVGTIDPSIGADPSIGFYIDDVYIGRGIGMFTGLFDLKRIEVIKGPQGSLWGRNTIGGAIHLITNQPGEDNRNLLNIHLGSFSDKSIGGLFSGSITDKLAGKASFNIRKRDGYSSNSFNNAKLSDADISTLRVGLSYQVSNYSELLVNADYTRDRSTSAAFKPLISGRPILGGLLGQISVEDFPFEHIEPIGAFSVNNSGNAREHRDIYGLSAKYTLEKEGYVFTSISAVRGAELDNIEQTDGLSIQLIELTNLTEQDQFSQEFRLTGSMENYDWTLGSYFFYERTEDKFGINSQDFNLLLSSLIGQKDFSSVNDSNISANSYAIYGRVEYALTNNLQMDFGIRYSRENKKFNYRRLSNEEPNMLFGTLFDPSVQESTLENTWDAFSPSLTVSYTSPKNDKMYYGTISKGFRSGGYNSIQSEQGGAFDPEHLLAYQVGVKSLFAGNRLQFDTSLFYYDHKDMQVPTLVSQGSGTVRQETANAAESTQRGIDLDIKAVISDSIQLDSGIAILDAKYDSFINASGIDVSGNMVRFASKYTGNLGVDYTPNWMSQANSRFRLEYSVRSKTFFTEGNSDLLFQPSYSLINSYLEFSLDAYPMTITFYGKNLKNEPVISTAVDFLEILGTVSQVYQAPRTFGIQLKLTL